MKNLERLFFVSIAVLGLTACSNEMDVAGDAIGDVKHVSMNVADFEWADGAETRTTAVNNGGSISFKWSAKDTVGIFPDKGDQVEFPIEAGAGTGTAVFNGGGWALKSQSTYVAYYPYNYNNRTGEAIPMTYEGQTQVGNNNLDNLTKCDYIVSSISTPSNGEASFQFKHMGALARFVLTVPEAANLTEFTLSSEGEVFPVGQTMNVRTNPVTITNKKMSKSIGMSLSSISVSAGSTVTLYMLLPAVNLNAKNLTATLASATSEYTATITGKNYESGKAYSHSATLEKRIKEVTYEDWTSTNKTNSSTSQHTYTIPYTSGQTLSFDWMVSSESNYDWLIVTLDGNEILKKSGTDSGHYTKTFTTSGTATLVAKYTKDGSQSDGSDEGKIYNIKVTGGSSTPSSTHEYVDLGLPSGTLWATCNIGAENPEDYGDFFAWGESTGYNSGKTSFSWSTYTLCNGSISTMTKYCTSSSFGTVDNKTELDPEDDAAYVNWGSEWRMPTRAQQDELRNTSYTTWTWTTMNGKNGYKVSKKSDSSVYIFLPAAGYRYDSSLNNAGGDGYYWSRSLSTSYSNYAYDLYFYSGYIDWYYDLRCFGFSVRPVYAK